MTYSFPLSPTTFVPTSRARGSAVTAPSPADNRAPPPRPHSWRFRGRTALLLRDTAWVGSARRCVPLRWSRAASDRPARRRRPAVPQPTPLEASSRSAAEPGCERRRTETTAASRATDRTARRLEAAPEKLPASRLQKPRHRPTYAARNDTPPLAAAGTER